MAEFDQGNIHQALSTLAKSGRIRRVLRGIYDYPRYSELLQQPLSPDMGQVAQALARKFNWQIYPTGEASLNLLGLSTQVPATWVYLSNGPNKEYSVDKHTLVFKRTAPKELGFSLPESGLLIQALRALGKDRVNDTVIDTLGQRWDSTTKARILKDTRTVSSWIYTFVKKICQVQEPQAGN